MKSLRTLTLLALFSLAFSAACGGCNGCGKDEIDAAAEARVTELTSFLPAQTDATLVVPNLDQLPQNLDYAFQRIESFQPEVRALENRLNQGFGVRLTDIDSWDDTGFDPDGSVVISLIGARPILAAYIDDRNAFETHFIGRIRRLTETAGSIETNEIGGRDFRMSGNRPGIDMAWFYEGNVVILAMPPLDALDVFETGSAAAIAQKIAATDADSSLASSESFAQFRQALGDHYPVSLYVNAARYMERPDLAEQTGGLFGLDPILTNLVNWTNANAEGAGIGIRAGDQRLELRAFAGADEDMVEEAQEAYATVADVNWDGFLTANTVLAGRTSVDLPRAYEAYVESLPDEDRRALRRSLSQMGRNYELDIEEDVIGAFSGHSMLVFYGLGGDRERMASLLMGGRIGDGVRAVLSGAGLMMNFHFEDDAKKDHLLDTFSSMIGGLAERRALSYKGDDQDGFEIFEPTQLDEYPGRLFSSANSLTLSTSAIGENAAYEYLTNNRDDEMLADSEEYPLGDQFATAEGINGLYLNFPNLRRHMRALPFIDGYAGVLRPIHELLITGGVDDHGFYVDAIVGFTDPLEDDDS